MNRRYRFAAMGARHWIWSGFPLVVAWAFAAFVTAFPAAAQEQDLDKIDIKELYNLSFDQLMEIDLLQVGSKKPLGKKEIPGTVTLIKREEILSSGARDLVDVLRLVPGFEFGADTEGTTGIAVRGLWTHEGKILVMMDGVMMNEALYANTPICNHFPLDHIERIEIIRGPGASFYGGFAEVAVVNIITRSAEDINGASVSAMLGQTGKTFGRAGASLAVGKKFEDFSFSLLAFAGAANQSNRDYEPLSGDPPYPMPDVHTQKPIFLNLAAQYGGLKTRLIYDAYRTTMRSGYYVPLPRKVSVDFTSLNFDAAYDVKLSEKLTLTPRLTYLQQLPWGANDQLLLDSADFSSMYTQKTIRRTIGGVTLSGDVAPKLFLTVGAEYYSESASAPDSGPESDKFFDRDSTGAILATHNSIAYNNVGAYAQIFWTTDIANVSGGLRFDRHSAFSTAFVPWLGITKVVGDFNAKLLFGQNFRAPSIANIVYNPNIKPELTTALELQLGYQILYNMFVSANLFQGTIKDPIVYGIDPATQLDSYANFESAGSRGVEIEYFLKDFWGTINANYSYFEPYQHKLDYYSTTKLDSVLGFARHKITLNASLRLFSDNFTINPSATFLSERWSYAGDNADGEPTFKLHPSLLLVNIFARYKNFLAQGLDVGLGVYDLGDARYGFIQPYRGGHAPLPAPSLEVIAKVSYTLPWK